MVTGGGEAATGAQERTRQYLVVVPAAGDV